MLLCRDGSSKQRGHREPPENWSAVTETLFPSGSAAIYRRAMLDEIGWFDERFFLYCEDTDVGLRGRWAGWECLYAPEARVVHEYSGSAGRASPLKGYFVELNRRFVVLKNFPDQMRARVPLYSLQRYGWHAVAAATGRGTAAGLGWRGALRLLAMAPKGIAAYLRLRPEMIREGEAIRRNARLTACEFEKLADQHSISAKEVAYR
jgi:GT2 family glycosyltransferase